MAKYRGPEVRTSKGCLLRNSLKSLIGPLGPLSMAHISCGVFSVCNHQATITGLCRILFQMYAFCHSPHPQAGSTQPQSLVHKHHSAFGGLEDLSACTNY